MNCKNETIYHTISEGYTLSYTNQLEITVQVGELHRLYQVQKKQMAELRNNEMRSLGPISQYPSSNATQMGYPHANQAHQHIFWSTSVRQSSHPRFVSPPSDRRLEEPSSSSHRRLFDLEQQTINADSSTCLRNAMVENERELVPGRCEKDVDTNLELTLSVGQASDSRKGKEKRPTNSSDGEGDSPSDMNNPSASQESSKKPHWLLRALSLNRT